MIIMLGRLEDAPKSDKAIRMKQLNNAIFFM